MMSPVININNSTINMTGQNVDLSGKSNMYSSFSSSNNNAGNLMAALSCLKRPLPRTVLGDQSNHTDHAPSTSFRGPWQTLTRDSFQHLKTSNTF